MSNIHVLDEKTAGKIAAGEVIERPSGVLKELLENAVDAGASSIHVDIEGAGKELIRVNDNGCGMSAEDLSLSVLRHATSKIKNFDDLEQLNTFGFRGEALYSVAAVSRMTLTSCTGEGPGHRLTLEAGKIVSQSPAPAIKGTTVEIRDLFFNTPARLKFLKSDSYERACLLKVIEESALANLSVGYTVRINGREVYNLPAQPGDFKQAALARARAVLGDEVAESLLFKQADTMGLKLFITPVDRLVSVRDMQYVFVNRRPIDSKTVQQAIYKAYQNARGKDKHPAFLVYLTLPANEFDVNIHPQKRDIRFTDEHRVFGFLMNITGETVFGASRPVEVNTGARPVDAGKNIALPANAQAAAAHLFTAPAQEAAAQPAFAKKEKSSPFNSFTPKQNYLLKDAEDSFVTVDQPAINKEPVHETVQSPEGKDPTWYVGPYHYLGQLQKSYLLFENPLGLVLIDQHAAQERVLFEHYLDAFEKREMKTQKLLFPIHVDLPPSNVETLLSWKDWLKTAGFEVEPFSARTVQVKTTPYVLRFKEDAMKAFIVSLAQVLGDPSKSTETLKRSMVAMLACKKAIKAHDQISATEAEALLENMKKCKDGMHCPHGRPCVAQLKMKEVDKLFGR